MKTPCGNAGRAPCRCRTLREWRLRSSQPRGGFLFTTVTLMGPEQPAPGLKHLSSPSTCCFITTGQGLSPVPSEVLVWQGPQPTGAGIAQTGPLGTQMNCNSFSQAEWPGVSPAAGKRLPYAPVFLPPGAPFTFSCVGIKTSVIQTACFPSFSSDLKINENIVPGPSSTALGSEWKQPGHASPERPALIFFLYRGACGFG